MDAIGDRELQAQLLETTYKYVRILLRSDRVRTHSGERSLLKNLGSWLGRLTIARSKPVRHKCASTRLSWLLHVVQQRKLLLEQQRQCILRG